MQRQHHRLGTRRSTPIDAAPAPFPRGARHGRAVGWRSIQVSVMTNPALPLPTAARWSQPSLDERSAEGLRDSGDWLTLDRQLLLACPRERAFACLRNLACLPRWWPQAEDLHPLPPGLCQRGDLACLTWRGQPTLLKVLDFQPDSRIVLSLRQPADILLLDLWLRPIAEGCRLRLRLETLRADGMLGSTRQALRLGRLLQQASARLRTHLQWELQCPT